MRLITIDNGNTNPTVGIFENEILQKVIAYQDYQQESGDFILLSSVGKGLTLTPSFDLKTKRTATHFFDMPVAYSQTLGDDRLIAAYKIYKELKENQKVLLIDAGTFITCDLVSSQGFEGGFIFPGIERFLNSYIQSAQLPLVPKEKVFQTNESLPHDTETAIAKACEIYLKASLDKVISAASPDKIILSGGSAKTIIENINLKVLFELDRHLVHSALALIHRVHLRQA